jgi:phosphoglycerate dehydrogenase-like enzyme
MRLLLSETALRRFGDRVREVAPDLELVHEGPADLAWATTDLFDEEPDKARAFFVAVLKSPELRWLQSPAAGLDAPFWPTILERGTRLTSSHVQAVSIAEFVLGNVLAHYQRPDRWRAAQAERRWERPERFRELHRSRWLVIGMGAIGEAVAERARGFGAEVIGARRSRRDGTVTLDQVPSVLPEADVVVLAMPATAEARGFVDASFLAAMKEGSVLVNVARGSVVDEPALLAALDRGVPELAVLDVFETEPLPDDSPFWSHPRVWVTPHASSSGWGSVERGAELFLDNLRRWMAGEPLLEEVTMDDVLEQQA